MTYEGISNTSRLVDIQHMSCFSPGVFDRSDDWLLILLRNRKRAVLHEEAVH